MPRHRNDDLIVTAKLAPLDRQEGCFRVLDDGDGGYHVAHYRHGRWMSGPYATRRQALARARRHARDYDEFVSTLPSDCVRVGQAAARGVREIGLMVGVITRE